MPVSLVEKYGSNILARFSGDAAAGVRYLKIDIFAARVRPLAGNELQQIRYGQKNELPQDE